jgi:PAS domain S-box-containing protein
MDTRIGDDPRGAPPEPRKHGEPELDGGGSQNEAIYRLVLATVLDPTITIDERGTILSASDSVFGMFGWMPDELVGKNIKLLMPEPYRSNHDGYLSEYRRTGKTQILGRTREFTVVRRDGTTLECELSVSRGERDGKPLPLLTGSFRDVTARKRAERELRASERRFRAIFDHSFEFMGLLKPDGTVLEINQTALDAADAKREDVLGKPFWALPWWSSEQTREQLREGIRRAAAGEFVRFEAEQGAKDGELLHVDFSLKPVRDDDGNVVLMIPEGRDITALKRAQRSETSLLRALATIGESAAVLAHEIKNPITAVNVALRAVADQLGEDHRVILEDLSSRMQRLERVMRRTLSFTRPVELKKSTFDVRDLVQQTLRALRPSIVKAGFDVQVALDGELAPIHADRVLLEEVLTNLLANALEAVEDRAGPHRALITARDTAEGELEITVADDGPGIPESMRATLFKPFFTTKSKGSGLGLAFCKKVIEEHGGTIEVDSGPGGETAGRPPRGARFIVRLPRNET